MTQVDNTKIIFGSWALRGKPHVIRIVMEYLKIPYQTKVYKTPQSWYEDPLAKSDENLYLPYLIDQDFIVYDPTAILIYVLKKYGHQNFLGSSIQDQAHVDMYLNSMKNIFKNVIGSTIKPTDSIQKLRELKEDIWKKGIQPKLLSIQNFLTEDRWFLDQISVVDFDIYQLVNYMRILFPTKLIKFKKMSQIAKKISLLPEIRQYSGSQNCQNLCYLPVQMCKRFKAQ